MASLLDAIRSGSAALQKPGITDESQKVAGLLRAKRGRAGVGPDVGASSLEEQQAVTSAGEQIQQQVAPQAALQQEQLGQEQRATEQGIGLQKSEIAQSRRFNALENKMKTQQLLSEFEQDVGKLDLEKNKAQVQQFAQGLRLSNQKYTDDLRREGSKSRLDDALQFEKEYTRDALDDSKVVMQKVFANDSIANMSDREFNKKLAQMGIDESYKLYADGAKAAREQALYTGIGNIAVAGIGAASSFKSAPATSTSSQNMTPSGMSQGTSGPMSSGTAGNYSFADSMLGPRK